MQSIKYWLAEHPCIVRFRWSHSQSWGSTWSFLFTSIAAYIATAAFLHLFLLLIRRRRPVPLGPIPALHSLAMALISVLIFVGILFSAAAEIRDTRCSISRFSCARRICGWSSRNRFNNTPFLKKNYVNGGALAFFLSKDIYSMYTSSVAFFLCRQLKKKKKKLGFEKS
ncbi:unnamed protein product, partial [Vitis vinifera]